jgi:hypothetical protein
MLHDPIWFHSAGPLVSLAWLVRIVAAIFCAWSYFRDRGPDVTVWLLLALLFAFF